MKVPEKMKDSHYRLSQGNGNTDLNTLVHQFTKALPIIAETWKQPKRPSAELQTETRERDMQRNTTQP